MWDIGENVLNMPMKERLCEKLKRNILEGSSDLQGWRMFSIWLQSHILRMLKCNKSHEEKN